MKKIESLQCMWKHFLVTYIHTHILSIQKMEKNVSAERHNIKQADIVEKVEK